MDVWCAILEDPTTCVGSQLTRYKIQTMSRSLPWTQVEGKKGGVMTYDWVGQPETTLEDGGKENTVHVGGSPELTP